MLLFLISFFFFFFFFQAEDGIRDTSVTGVQTCALPILAQQMLSQLRDLLDRLQSGRMADQGQSQRFGQMMDEFGNLLNRQQRLLDDTFGQQRRQNERGQRGQGQRGQQGQQGQRGQQGQQGQ